MTRLQMSVYLEVAKEVSLRLREVCPSPTYRCSDKHTWHISTGSHCGVLCCNHVHDIMDSIDIIHNGHIEDLFRIVSRSGGVNEVLLRMCCDMITILGLNNHSYSTVDMLIKLDQCLVGEKKNVRDGLEPF